jgi:hypothetical protein
MARPHLMSGILSWLLDRSMGQAGPDGRWSPWLSWTFHGSNFVIACTFVAIPLIIAHHWRYKRDGLSTGMFLRGLSFFILQGFSRFLRTAAILGPFPRLMAITDAVTAVAALYGVWQLSPLIVHILKLPSREEIHDLNGRLNGELLEKINLLEQITERKEALKVKLREAEDRVAELTWKREADDWWRSRKQSLGEIDALLDDLGVPDG